MFMFVPSSLTINMSSLRLINVYEKMGVFEEKRVLGLRAVF
jgi:hypothetical protein